MPLLDSQIDIRRHPLDASSLVTWMLAAWAIEPDQTLLILTADGDGEALDNRIRVRLTKARKSVERQGAKSNRFGFHSTCIKWTELTGDTCEALFLHRVVTRKHLFGMIIDDDMKGHA